MGRVSVAVTSPEVASASLHTRLPWYTHIYTLPFLALYPLLAYAYFIRYDDWLRSAEWTFLACVSLGAGHALSFLATRWSTTARALITCRSASSVRNADAIRIVPAEHRGKGEIVSINKKDVSIYYLFLTCSLSDCLHLTIWKFTSHVLAGRPYHIYVLVSTRYLYLVI